MIIIAAMLMLLLVVGANAQACSAADQLAAFLAFKYAGQPRQLLAFAHLKQEWMAYDWDGKKLQENTHLVERRFSDRPRMLFRGAPEILVVVVDTNPVVFRVSQTEATQVVTEDLASIQAFLSAAGGFLTSAVKVRGQNAAQMAAMAAMVQQRSVGANVLPSNATLMDRVAALVPVLESRSKSPASEAGVLKAELNKVKGAVKSSERDVDRLATFAQLIENGTGNATPLAGTSDTPAKLDAALDALRSITVTDPPCAGVVDALGAVIRMKLTGLSSDRLAAFKALGDYRDAVDKLVAPDCDDDDLRPAIADVARWLRDNPPNDVPIAPGADADGLLLADRTIQDYAQLAADIGALKKGTQEVLDKRAALIVASSGVAQIVGRIAGLGPCALTNGVIEVPRAQQTNQDLPFGHEGNEAFKIVTDAPFEKLALRHGNQLERKFALRRQGWIDPDFDTGLTYTKLNEPTFEAVDDGGLTGGKIIRRTKESTKSGQLGLFLTAHFTKLTATRYVAPQIGFIASTDHPGAMAGMAISLGPYIKVSGGRTWQKVTKLAKGLAEGQPLAKGDTVRTRDSFASRGYLALSFTIDNVGTLFKN
jgi:hypothetical protein